MMQNSLPKWLEESGVGGYGYYGSPHLSAGYGAQHTVKQPEHQGIFSRFVAALIVLLKLPIVACRGDRALERYYARYPWLYRTVMAVILTAAAGALLVVCLLP